MEEDKQKEQTKQPMGWRDVVIQDSMPLTAIIDFMNILNQRLARVEEIITVKNDKGEEITLAQLDAATFQTTSGEQQQQQE